MKCPNCDYSNLRVIGNLGPVYINSSYHNIVEGTCSNCGRFWGWTEVFTFDHYENIEEIETDDHL